MRNCHFGNDSGEDSLSGAEMHSEQNDTEDQNSSVCSNGKQQIAKTVSVDAGDIAAFNDLKAAGVECFVQGVPTEPAVDLFKLL